MAVIWTEYAISQLKDIFDLYLLKNENAAIKIYNEIVDSVEPLLKFPTMAQKEQLLAKKKIVYRSLVVLKNFKIVYSVSKGTVYIVDIWDCRKNPKTNITNIK